MLQTHQAQFTTFLVIARPLVRTQDGAIGKTLNMYQIYPHDNSAPGAGLIDA
jgi:hypothetical protein